MISVPRIKQTPRMTGDEYALHAEGLFRGTIVAFGEVKEAKGRPELVYFSIEIRTEQGIVREAMNGFRPIVYAMHSNKDKFIGMTVDVMIRHRHTATYGAYAGAEILWRGTHD